MLSLLLRNPVAAQAQSCRSANDDAAEFKSLLPAALVLPLASFTIEGDEIFWKTVSLLAPCSVSVRRARPWMA
jgi:hypothetical protein